ncbi:MAG: tRNA (adenosine(37)-N6)-threonylcarbamoyltransferase complex transferase subunit TsaD [Patescibacteria group bacterium]|nr:tRNA (adenosine(37)-N6)-threonylcarbamoyltransferase complex transferase subunit TsaD [Patescibacteria group bacterium]MDE2116342.1 tRNA (adenosine(37)-N6)-threonylcarbamoyltransferase complex transferase subunit TsaD [Patescibacteria group bacterium]
MSILRILGIETSCDETAISLIEVDEAGAHVRVLGNAVHSQIDVHASYGGVFPTLAKREHQRNLVPVLEKVLRQADMLERMNRASATPEKIEAAEAILSREPELWESFKATVPVIARPAIDFISVTIGPGLEPALWVGINFARALATVWDMPVVPCNHMEGHILAALIQEKAGTFELLERSISYPAISLLISGGHTQIVLVESIDALRGGIYRIVGETRDDAVGECFDKIARTLGLAYPGGPKISRLAALARKAGIESPEPLPRPMMESGDIDFSFSGLKTAVLYLTRRLSGASGAPLDEAAMRGIARETEDAITDVLVAKMRKAVERYAVATLIIGGGVIANSHIREALEKLANECSLSIFLPQIDHSTDNGLMIALAGYFGRTKAVSADTTLAAAGTLALGLRAAAEPAAAQKAEKTP